MSDGFVLAQPSEVEHPRHGQCPDALQGDGEGQLGMVASAAFHCFEAMRSALVEILGCMCRVIFAYTLAKNKIFLNS